MAVGPVLAIATAVSAGVAALSTGATLLRGKPKPLAPARQVTQNEARLRADRNDMLAARTGTRANKRMGFEAGEAFTGPKKSLLGR